MGIEWYKAAMPPASTTNCKLLISNSTPLGSVLTRPLDAEMAYEVSARLAPSNSGMKVMAAQ